MPNFLSMALKMLSALTVLSLVACQESKKPDTKNRPPLTEQEQADKQKKAEEAKQKVAALRRQVLIEHKSLRLVDLTESRVSVRSVLKINRTLKSILFSMVLNGSSLEQFDIQDKTAQIASEFPEHNLEVSAYKFKSGSIDMLALEYRLMKFENEKEEGASQFVLLILDQSLGDKSIVKTQFEYPSKSDLKTWAKSAQISAMGPR